MFLSCKPAVTVINEEYELLINTKENGIVSVLVGNEVFYEENSGVLASEKNYVKIRVPQSLLDKEKNTPLFSERALSAWLTGRNSAKNKRRSSVSGP